MSDLFRLEGRGALVTGGAGILGQHFCRGLAEAGARVVVADLDGAAAQALAKDIPGALGLECDVSNPQSVAECVHQAVAHCGSLRVLLNNAATKTASFDTFLAPFEDYSLETWREVMAVNIDGMFLMAQAVGKHMLETGNGGAIIQTASIYGISAPDQRIYEGSEYMGKRINTPAVYATSKAAVVGLSQYLATYWADAGIRVNTLVPGGVESGQNDAFKAAYTQRTPLGRMARAEEMVGAVIYLASDAASYVTGQTLAVDGGWTAW
ncbi:SDR family oxidoreductase [Magnetospira sp. QH-2]|uniref:SDR family oxidoreductase n=1 Tax=Magnetospira sp. (strain QH-2) TaxID=1288970 RepID=UPI0003E8165C|nr:SDR family oxidoreductase [Magnetospira sp. QH-2]CCQ75526.1 short-chain dehydrogenase/reductase [Magnetospira sp. QH-2]